MAKKKRKVQRSNRGERPKPAPILDEMDEDLEEELEEEEAPARSRHLNRARQIMELEVPLTQTEIRERKDQAFELVAEIQNINRQLEKMNRGFMKARAEKESELEALLAVCEARKEKRKVPADLLIEENGDVKCFHEGTCLKVITLRQLKGLREGKANDEETELFGKPSRPAAAKRQ